MSMRNIDLNLLVFLDVLLKERNVTRAAESLGISQPAMSNGLRRLRDLFADPLLVRTSDGMKPTERAELLQPMVRDVLASIEQAVEPKQKFNEKKATQEWLDALKPLGTDKNKSFLEEAPYLIAVFEKKNSIKNNKKIKNYYVKESVGIATGILISCLHFSGLSMLTHTPSPMNFLNSILKRPDNEKPFVLLVVGKPKDDCKIPVFATKKKSFSKIATEF